MTRNQKAFVTVAVALVVFSLGQTLYRTPIVSGVKHNPALMLLSVTKGAARLAAGRMVDLAVCWVVGLGGYKLGQAAIRVVKRETDLFGE